MIPFYALDDHMAMAQALAEFTYSVALHCLKFHDLVAKLCCATIYVVRRPFRKPGPLIGASSVAAVLSLTVNRKTAIFLSIIMLRSEEVGISIKESFNCRSLNMPPDNTVLSNE